MEPRDGGVPAAPAPPSPASDAAPETDAAPTETSEESKDIDFDALLTANLGHMPEFSQEESHTGVNWTEAMGDLSPDARKLLHNLRADYTRKTQALSEERKRFEEQASAAKQSDVQLIANADLSIADIPELPEDLDLYDPKQLQVYIDHQAAKRAKELMERVQAPAKAEAAKEARFDELRSFAARDDVAPYIKSLRPRMMELMDGPNPLNLENAFYRARAEAAHGSERELRASLEDGRRSRREAGEAVGSGGRRRTIRAPAQKPRTAAEAYELRRRAGHPGFERKL